MFVSRLSMMSLQNTYTAYSRQRKTSVLPRTYGQAMLAQQVCWAWLHSRWLTSLRWKRAILHAQEFPGSHTAAAISVAFENMLEQWHVTKENVHVVIRDNARNMAKAMGESGIASLGCVAHTLQLTVNEGVFSQWSISDCVAIGRKIVGHFKHSNVATCRFNEV